MATTWGYLPPASVLNGGQRTIDSLTLPFTGTNAVDDVLVLAAGVLTKAATNAAIATLAGLALKNYAALYYSAAGGTGALFGIGTTGTALTPGTPQQMEVNPWYEGTFVQMSLNQVWNPGVGVGPGTTVGLALDAPTGYFVADSTQANKIGVAVALVVLSSQQGAAVGDTGLRILVQINNTTALG